MDDLDDLSPSSSVSSPTDADDTDLSTLAILITSVTLGSVLLIGFLLVSVILLRLFVCKKKRHVYSTVHHDGGKLSQPESRVSLEGVTITPTPSTCDKSAVIANKLTVPTDSAVSSASSTPLAIRRETFVGARLFSTDNLHFLDKIGDGEYGPLYRAEAHGWSGPSRSRIVIAKLLDPEANEEVRRKYKSEADQLSMLNHKNSVGLLAICIDKRPECLLLDAGRQRDMLQYVLKKRKEIFGLGHLSPDTLQSSDDLLDLLHYAGDICSGMTYLAFKKIVHHDLGLRNCIVGYDGTVKVAMYGVSHQWYPESYYEVDGELLAIRWLSPEAIAEKEFTTAGDVWSYGVTLWELFMYGETPLFEHSNEEVIELVKSGQLLFERPLLCSEGVYGVLESCCVSDASNRPEFEMLHYRMQELIADAHIE